MKKTGYTQLQNSLLESLPLLKIGAYEYKFVLIIARRTFGFHKDFARISSGNFAAAAGVQDIPNIFRTLQKLLNKEIIEKRDSNNGPEYRINPKVIHRVPLSPETGYLCHQRQGTSVTRDRVPLSPETEPLYIDKERIKEKTKEIDLSSLAFKNWLKTNFPPETKERLKKQIAKSFKFTYPSEAFEVQGEKELERILKETHDNNARDPVGYAYRAAQNVGKEFRK